MTLQTTLQYMTRRAFTSLGSTLLPGTWMHRALPTYDPATSVVTAPAPELFPVDVLVSQYRREEVDGVRVLATDRRLCVFQVLLQDDLSSAAHVPKGLPIAPTVRDQVEIGSTVWHLLEVAQDAAALTWQCHARAEGEQP